MARKFSKAAGRKVERAMEEMKSGNLRSGRSDKKVTNARQAIAIGLSEARAEGKKAPPPPKKKAAAKKRKTTKRAKRAKRKSS